MNAHNEALVRDVLKMTDTQGDIFGKTTFYRRTQMGTARSKETAAVKDFSGQWIDGHSTRQAASSSRLS
jgi:hypothetical protein